MRVEPDSKDTLERRGMEWPVEAPCITDPRQRIAPGAAGVGARSRVAREMLQTVVLALFLFAGTRFVLQSYIVENISMEPTLQGGQHIWVDKAVYRLQGGLHRGDIVVFQSWGQDKPFVKRVVGLPGETITIRDGRLIVDGHAVDEPYLDLRTDGADGPYALAGDEYFVMGDNRPRSGDSRMYGPLQADDVIGRAWLRTWPPTEVGLLSGTPRPLFASDLR